ncbi:MAG: PilT/PilU family type 4a pilus ATPase, partial [Myxococcota bacterium]|nr:PilT/PilU family type 4a pilus ATPase [Myxococcota bacterium]
MHDILKTLVELGASDLHLAVGRKPRARIHGRLEDMPFPVLDAKRMASCMKSIVTRDRYATFEETGDLDFAFELEGVARFRCNYLATYGGLAAVLRVVSDTIIPLETLNLPPLLQELTTRKSGLILVTGPTGSGKSTTLAALIDVINANQPRHIILIEDPVEFVHSSKTGFITQREVGTHTESFAAALRGAVREDPDVILVGEMRDQETVSMTLTAAEMGFLVFGTLHTNGAGKTIDRLVDIFPEERQPLVRNQLANSLVAIISQLLLPASGGEGRVAVCETLVSMPAFRKLVREGHTHMVPSYMQQHRAHGCLSMDEAIVGRVASGHVDRDQAIHYLRDPELLA